MTTPESPENATQNPERAAERGTRNWGRLERPGTRRRVMTELARGEKTQQQIADEYGVAKSSITEFKQRHRDQIDEIARDIENEFAGLWIADKLNRLDELQGLYADDMTPRERETRASILRAAAEELGQIPNRTTISMEQPVRVEITGLEDV